MSDLAARDTSHWHGDQNNALVHAGNDGIHISALAMKITWGNDNRFWKWIDLSKEMLPQGLSTAALGSHKVASLVQVSWLEVTGSLNLGAYMKYLSQSETYEIIYHIKFKNDAFGWSNAHVTFLAETTGGPKGQTSLKLDSYKSAGTEMWHKIPGGVFKLPQTSEAKLEFGMFEVHSLCWKGGLVLAGVTIKPKK